MVHSAKPDHLGARCPACLLDDAEIRDPRRVGWIGVVDVVAVTAVMGDSAVQPMMRTDRNRWR